MQNNDNKIFANGIWSYEIPETAPTFIKGKQAYKVKEFIKFLQENEQYAVNGFLTIVIKESQAGKRYAELDLYDYKKKNGEVENPNTGYDKFQQSRNKLGFTDGSPVPEELPVIDINEPIDVSDIPFN
jgi:hypothetical protein